MDFVCWATPPLLFLTDNIKTNGIATKIEWKIHLLLIFQVYFLYITYFNFIFHNLGHLSLQTPQHLDQKIQIKKETSLHYFIHVFIKFWLITWLTMIICSNERCDQKQSWKLQAAHVAFLFTFEWLIVCCGAELILSLCFAVFYFYFS